VIGGENKPRVPIGSEVFCLDLDTCVWKLCVPIKGDPPVSRNAHAAAEVGRNIYIFGGRSGITMGEGSLNDMHMFDTEERTWKSITPKGNSPDQRSYHVMTTDGSRLYVFGGCGESGRMNDLWAYDIANNDWEKLPSNDDIEGRGGSGLVTYNGDLYVVAGFAGREMNDVHRYNLASNKWSRLSFETDLPPRSVFGITPVGSSIFVLFGEVDESDKGHEGAGCFSDECYMLDTQNAVLKWEKLATHGDVPEPRGWLSAASVKNGSTSSILVFGGNNLDNNRLNDTHILQLSC